MNNDWPSFRVHRATPLTQCPWVRFEEAEFRGVQKIKMERVRKEQTQKRAFPSLSRPPKKEGLSFCDIQIEKSLIHA